MNRNAGDGESQAPGGRTHQQHIAALNFIIQNEKEVIRKSAYNACNLFKYLAWKRSSPMSTTDLNDYISIKFISVITSTVSQGLVVHQRISHLRQL